MDTSSSNVDTTLTLAMVEEARQLIQALAPKEAPSGVLLIKGSTGLNIMKSDMMPENTIMVSKRLFDLIFESAQSNDDMEEV